MRKVVLGLVAAQVLTAGAAWARTADGTAAEGAPAAHESVQVSGLRDPEFKPYRTMLLGVDAFWQGAFVGLFILLAAGFERFRIVR